MDKSPEGVFKFCFECVWGEGGENLHSHLKKGVSGAGEEV